MLRKGTTTETGARTADRNESVANWFSIARGVWNMHDALLIEQRRTNRLLEALIEQGGGEIPDPGAIPNPTTIAQEYDPGTGMPIEAVVQ